MIHSGGPNYFVGVGGGGAPPPPPLSRPPVPGAASTSGGAPVKLPARPPAVHKLVICVPNASVEFDFDFAEIDKLSRLFGAVNACQVTSKDINGQKISVAEIELFSGLAASEAARALTNTSIPGLGVLKAVKLPTGSADDAAVLSTLATLMEESRREAPLAPPRDASGQRDVGQRDVGQIRSSSVDGSGSVGHNFQYQSSPHPSVLMTTNSNMEKRQGPSSEMLAQQPSSTTNIITQPMAAALTQPMAAPLTQPLGGPLGAPLGGPINYPCYLARLELIGLLDHPNEFDTLQAILGPHSANLRFVVEESRNTVSCSLQGVAKANVPVAERLHIQLHGGDEQRFWTAVAMAEDLLQSVAAKYARFCQERNYFLPSNWGFRRHDYIIRVPGEQPVYIQSGNNNNSSPQQISSITNK